MIPGLRAGLFATLIAPTLGFAAEPAAPAPPAVLAPPALVLRLERPHEQLAYVLALFEGARAPHPAAALAGWRRATGDHESLDKTAQALIALFNPAMVTELRQLDGTIAEISAGLPPRGWAWRAMIPHDDGTLAALATALALTDGASEPALEDGVPVDRLGPVGAPLMARRPDGALALAPDRGGLVSAFRLRESPDLPGGLHLRLVTSAALPPNAPLAVRRVAAGLDATGCRTLELSAAFDANHAFAVRLRGAFEGAAPAADAIDPSWLDWVPADAAASRIAAAVVLAVDPQRAAWDRLFAVADRVEKADPALANVAPIRARLNLAALAAGVRPERDLLPHVKGITAAWATDADGHSAGWLVVLHTADEAAATRILERVARPLATRLKAGPPLQRGASVMVASAVAMGEAALDAASQKGLSQAPALREFWKGTPSAPQRLGILWPGRLALKGPLADGLDAASPVVWAGGHDGNTSWDVARWPDLHILVRAALERLPMAPAPAHPGADNGKE